MSWVWYSYWWSPNSPSRLLNPTIFVSFMCPCVSIEIGDFETKSPKEFNVFLYINTLQYIALTLQPFDAHFVCWRFYPMASLYKIHFIHSVVFPNIYVHRKYCLCMTFKFPALKRKVQLVGYPMGVSILCEESWFTHRKVWFALGPLLPLKFGNGLNHVGKRGQWSSSFLLGF